MCSSSGQPGPGCQEPPNHHVQQNAGSTGAGEEWPGTPQVQSSTEQIYSAAASGQPGGKGDPAAEKQLVSLTWSWWLSDQLRQLSARDRLVWHGTGYAGNHPGGFGMSTVGRLYDLLGQSLPELCHSQSKVLPQELKRNSYRNPPLFSHLPGALISQPWAARAGRPGGAGDHLEHTEGTGVA